MTPGIEPATKVYTAPFVLKDDNMGSVVKPSAFTDGREVPMIWSHRWEAPIGKGTLKVCRKQAEEPVIASALRREET